MNKSIYAVVMIIITHNSKSIYIKNNHKISQKCHVITNKMHKNTVKLDMYINDEFKKNKMNIQLVLYLYLATVY